MAPDMDRSWSDKSFQQSKKKPDTGAAAGVSRVASPGRAPAEDATHRSRRNPTRTSGPRGERPKLPAKSTAKRPNGSAIPSLPSPSDPADVAQAAAAKHNDSKKPHPNQWTYLKKDDPNRPKGANQYTVKKRLEALAAAAAEEAARGVEDGEAAAAYAVALAQRQKAQMRPNVLARQAAKAAAAEGFSTPSSTKTASASGSTPVVKKKASASATAASAKAKETASTSQSSTAQAKKKSTASTSQKQSKKEHHHQAAVDEDASSTVSEDDRIYCVCQQLYDPERMMIACDRCDNWYHNDCVGIDDDDVEIVDQFICPNCASSPSLSSLPSLLLRTDDVG